MTDILKNFKSELSSAYSKERVPLSNIKDFNLSEDEEDQKKDIKREKSTDYLKDGVTIKDILILVRNKKLSNNKIKSEIRKLLKDESELIDFLMSFIPKKEENKEATSAGAGAGAYDSPLFSDLKEEKLKGGKSDNKTFADLVKKYKNKTQQELKSQLSKGIKVEMEHTEDRSVAKEIAIDHLFEDPNYYTKLKKIETKEATSSASSGQYSTPKMWAKSTSKKDWRGRSKTQIPGGKFVQVKKKCKRFPYCNQGDIKALNIFSEEILQKTIKKVSQKYGISENDIEELILREINTNNK
jgi:hypothetical protein